MADEVRAFFEGLESRVDPSKLSDLELAYRFEVAGVGTWNVTARDGRLSVSEEAGEATTVFRMQEETFARLLSGELAPAKAFMLGKLRIEGDMGGALKLKELFF